MNMVHRSDIAVTFAYLIYILYQSVSCSLLAVFFTRGPDNIYKYYLEIVQKN